MRILEPCIKRVAFVAAVVIADATTRLQRDRGDPVIDQFLPYDVVRLCECRVDRRRIALLIHEAHVIRTIGPHCRCIRRDRAFHARHRLQRRVVHLYQFRGVTGLQLGFGNHEGDTITDQPGAPIDQGRPGGMIHRRSVPPLLGRIFAGKSAIVFSRPVRARQNSQNARGLFRLIDIDRLDISHRMRGAQDVAPGLTSQVHIVQKLTASGQKPRILFPRHRLPNCKVTHSLKLSRPIHGRPSNRSDLPFIADR